MWTLLRHLLAFLTKARGVVGQNIVDSQMQDFGLSDVKISRLEPWLDLFGV